MIFAVLAGGSASCMLRAVITAPVPASTRMNAVGGGVPVSVAPAAGATSVAARPPASERDREETARKPWRPASRRAGVAVHGGQG